MRPNWSRLYADLPQLPAWTYEYDAANGETLDERLFKDTGAA